MSKRLQRRFFFCLPVNRGTIKHHGEHGAHKPAHRPGQPDAVHAQPTGKQDGQHHAQEQVGKGGCHKAAHHAAAAHQTVRSQLEGQQQVEGCDRLQEGQAGVDGLARGAVHKEHEQLAACQQIQGREAEADAAQQPDTGPKTRLDTLILPGTQILGGVVGNAAAQRGQGGDEHIVQLGGRGKARDHAGTEGVDHALDDDIAH